MQISSATSAQYFTYSGKSSTAGNSPASPAESVSPEQQREIQKLKDRDQEVRAHEQAHLSAAGGIALSGANFQFVTGPDGERYATGGEVNIDTSEVAGDPEATIRKAETIRRAALAPAQPSGQDFSVASSAQSMSAKARIELLRNTSENNANKSRQGSLFDSTV